MKRWILAICLTLGAWSALAQDQKAEKKPDQKTEQAAPVPNITSVPQGRGQPVYVRAGLSFLQLQGIDENDGSFTATVDMRLRWQDLRLAYPADQEATGYQEFTEADADKKLTQIWQPNIEFNNLKGSPTFQKRGLRIYPNGRVEMMQRTTGAFNTDFSLENFPFDKQKLVVELIARNEPIQKVMLDFQQDDLEFSNAQHGGGAEGWVLGLVELAKSTAEAWHGEQNSQLKIALVVKRDQKSLLATIFVPLFASLLIPLLVLWLNKIEDGEFAIDAFQLTNISIGGLFAVVALNFTVNSSFVKLAAGDNPVMRLFGLNYFLLALSIAVGILLYRFNLVKRLFGPYVQEEFFIFINWAVPVVVFATATAMVLMAVF
ncbi:MAG: hypothetical protein V4772_15975 [Pseudomonadota bacterium]